MGLPDALLLALLAFADTLLLIYLRRRRKQALTLERMTRSLRFAIERENSEKRRVPRVLLQRAS